MVSADHPDPSSSPEGAPPEVAPRPPSRRARIARHIAVIWACLLALSNVSQMIWPGVGKGPPPQGSARTTLNIPEYGAHAPVPDKTANISFLTWPPSPEAPPPPGAPRAPIVLLHGSPGAADDFASLAPILARAGHEVISVDLPGFGRSERWVGDYSIAADARTLLRLLDERAIQRAHIIGWSLGGGVGIELASLAPDRVASLTLLAAIGSQEAEGSGNYYFEHTKYALGFALAVALPEVIPHFGLLGDRAFRFAFIRSFWDTDQRPLRAKMEALETPTLILHGRRDFLVPSWGAEHHHGLIRSSRLVMLDANHFLPMRAPFGQAPQTAEHILAFVARHDAPGVAPLTGSADFAPLAGDGTTRVGGFTLRHSTAWWLIILIIVIGTFITEDGTVIAVGLAIAHGQIDLGVGVIGCLLGIAAGDFGLYAIGRVFGRRALRWPAVRNWLPEKSLDRWGRWFDRHTIQAVLLARIIPGTRLPTYLAAGLLSRRTHGFLLWAGLAAFVWTPLVLGLVIALGPGLLDALRSVFSGPVAIVASVLVLFLGLRTAAYMFTWEGRRRLARDAALPFRPEFWPMWLFYLPLAPYIIFLSLRNRGPLTVTCINPGIPHGGGVVGESKIVILGKLSAAEQWIVPTALIEARHTPAERAAQVDRLVGAEARFGGYPVVLKPDEAQRGHGFKVVRSRAEAEAYFLDMTRPALLQKFHPGPHEVGILWTRVPNTGHGRIFSITRKRFPVIVGDGKRSLDRLILTHPRFRMQAETFLKRFDAMRDRVLAKGEEMSLAVAGNHCQGTMFLDGADLITHELERAIDEIALSFEHDGLDFGRFDARFESEDDLRAGRNFAIIELNGTMSESTNLYDPRRSVFWMYSVLFRQWRTMFALGAARRREGRRPMRLAELVGALRDHFRGRPGSAVAD